jgi:GxxExxY protein
MKKKNHLKTGYKGKGLRRGYPADFIVYDQIVPGVKATSFIVEGWVDQTVHFLKASGLLPGIIASFGQPSLVCKRIVFGCALIRVTKFIP